MPTYVDTSEAEEKSKSPDLLDSCGLDDLLLDAEANRLLAGRQMAVSQVGAVVNTRKRARAPGASAVQWGARRAGHDDDVVQIVYAASALNGLDAVDDVPVLTPHLLPLDHERRFPIHRCALPVLTTVIRDRMNPAVESRGSLFQQVRNVPSERYRQVIGTDFMRVGNVTHLNVAG